MDQAQEQRLREAASWSVARGSLLFHLDLAAAIARDHVAANGLAPDTDGWAVDVGPNGYEVVFLADDPDQELLAVTFAADGSPIAEKRSGAPSRRQRALAAAARTAAALPGPERRSVVVVPPAADAADAPVEAYVMRLADRPGDMAVGVHTRVRLSPDGRRVLGSEPLSRSPLMIEGSEGRPPLDVTVTHLLGPVPSEAHVYLSLKHGVPISVITTENEEQWIVDGELVSLL